MIARALTGCALLLLLTPAVEGAAQQGGDPARLYGRVVAVDGTTYEGFLRWGPNEAGWFDILHSSKRIPDRNRRDAERLGWEPEQRENRIEIFGVGITFPGERRTISRTAQSGIRFGHLSSLERVGGSRAVVVLKSGAELELEGGGDLGSALGQIAVEDIRGGETRLRWSDVRTIDFMAAPPVSSRLGERLYGTLVTRDGDRFTGYIVWDMDEIFTTDVLDGRENGRDRDIPFARIRAIARNSSRSARVWLDSGDELVLDGTNDVNSGNRDIMVADPALGEVRVGWEALDRVDLSAPPAAPEFSAFDGGRRLRGTVESTSGERYAGLIRWDNDEEYTWEILDGELARGVQMDIEMGSIASIERTGVRQSTVVLRDGRRFVLGGSNDVDDSNRGVYIEREDGSMALVAWHRFRKVDFDG